MTLQRKHMILLQSACTPDHPAHAHNLSIRAPTVLAVAAICDRSLYQKDCSTAALWYVSDICYNV